MRKKIKYVFDSEKEFRELINEYCPSHLGLSDIVKDCYGGSNKENCRECWEQSGLEYEITNKESITMTDKTPKEITYTDCVYELIKEECEGMDSIYEDYIIKLVGHCGLAALHRANLIESCGVINCRRLYVLCEKGDGKTN